MAFMAELSSKRLSVGAGLARQAGRYDSVGNCKAEEGREVIADRGVPAQHKLSVTSFTLLLNMAKYLNISCGSTKSTQKECINN